MKRITNNQEGIISVQLIIIAVLLVVVGGLVFWRVNQSSRGVEINGTDSSSVQELDNSSSEAELLESKDSSNDDANSDSHANEDTDCNEDSDDGIDSNDVDTDCNEDTKVDEDAN